MTDVQPLPTEPPEGMISIQQWFLDTTSDLPDGLRDYVKAREQHGIDTYGRALYPFNGRSAIQDAFEEAFDLMMYLIQMHLEGDDDIAELLPAVFMMLCGLWSVKEEQARKKAAQQ